MQRQAGILQQRHETGAFKRRGIQAQERIGGKKNEEQKRRRNQALHAQRRAGQPFAAALKPATIAA